MGEFLAETVETSASGFSEVDVDVAMVPEIGPLSLGFDIGPAYGYSVAVYNTTTYSIPDLLSEFRNEIIRSIDNMIDDMLCGC